MLEPRTRAEAEERLLAAVDHVSCLTCLEPRPSARDRLLGAVGYRLYRSLVNGLLAPSPAA